MVNSIHIVKIKNVISNIQGDSGGPINYYDENRDAYVLTGNFIRYVGGYFLFT